MTNLEKYKDYLLNYVDTHNGDLQDLITDFMDGQDVDFSNYCGTDNMIALWWLLEEYKEPILDEKERRYLSVVIRPFRKEVTYIMKNENEDYQYISVKTKDDSLLFPSFRKNKMYRNMKVDKKYLLKELGLWPKKRN